MFCAKCGHANAAAALFCIDCGAPLIPPTAQAEVDDPMALYGVVVGNTNQHYYLDRFERFLSQGKVDITWHWPAFFLSFYWMLYRKMWVPALIYFFAPPLLAIPIGVVAGLTGIEAILGVSYLLYLVGIGLVVPMYANALYFKHCARIIAKAKAASPNQQRLLGELTSRGGTSGVAIIVLFVVGIMVIGILAAVALPAYQDYTIRARVHGAYAEGRIASNQVADYYHRTEAVPPSLEDAGYSGPAAQSLTEVKLDSTSGILTVTVNQSGVRGKTMVLTPALDANKRVSWTCHSEQIPDKHLPKECRGK